MREFAAGACILVAHMLVILGAIAVGIRFGMMIRNLGWM
jgi:hypothetical protein